MGAKISFEELANAIANRLLQSGSAAALAETEEEAASLAHEAKKQDIALLMASFQNELDKQHQLSRIMAYRDIETKAGSGNAIRMYANTQADKLEEILEATSE